MRNRVIYSLFIILSLLVTPFTQAQTDVNYFEFYPVSSMQLGKGFVKDDFTKTFKDALTIDSYDTATNNAINSYLGMSVIYDAQTLKDKFHLDSKIEARYLTFKGSASFNMDFNSAFQSNSLTILLEATSEFGQIRLNNPRLDPSAATLLRQGSTGYAQFKTDYGTHFVNAIRRGISVYAVITISNISRDLQNKIGFQTKGEASFGVGSGSFKLDISKEMVKASQQKRIDVKVLAKGGQGIGALDGIIKSLTFDTDNIDKIMNEIGNYVSNLNYKASAPIGYFTSPYSQYGLDHRDIWTDERERIVHEITQEYNRLYLINENIDKYTDKSNYKYLLIDLTKIKEIEEYSIIIKTRLSELVKLHRTSLTEEDLTKIHIPPKLEIPLERLIPKLPNFDIIHNPRVNENFPIFKKLPLDFYVFSDANFPDQLNLIENIELLADDKVALDFRSILKSDKTISFLPIELISTVYCAKVNPTELEKELKKFEEGIYKSITTDWGNKEVFYKVKLTDVFGRTFINNFYTGTYYKRSDGTNWVNYFPRNNTQFIYLPYQSNRLMIDMPSYSLPSKIDTFYLFSQPIIKNSTNPIDLEKYYNIKLSKGLAVLAGFSTEQPLGLTKYPLTTLKVQNTINIPIPLSFPFDAIKYYWSVSPQKLQYNETTQQVSNYEGTIEVILEDFIGASKVISIPIK
ncbi:MAG TPA: hypothetical protein VHP32_06860 [Ignavibacteria bacterium]|nr:hypothetical protein [Ignavibacteria bacterium]